MTGTLEEIDKLRGGNVVFPQSECFYRNDMLWPLRIETARLIFWAAH